MSKTKKIIEIENWLSPEISWSNTPDTFFVKVSVLDGSVLEFISSGKSDCSYALEAIPAVRYVHRLFAKDNRSLSFHIFNAAWDVNKLKPRILIQNACTLLTAYCHGVFRLPGDEFLGIIIGRTPSLNPGRWLSDQMKAVADALLKEHRLEFDRISEEERLKEERFNTLRESLKAANPDYPTEREYFAFPPPIYPNLTCKQILPFLPHAVTFSYAASAKATTLMRYALDAVSESNWPESRDGSYEGALCGPPGKQGWALISWLPHAGLPSYPEVRQAVQKALPSAMRKPRIATLGKPVMPQSTSDISTIEMGTIYVFDLNRDFPKNEKRSHAV